MSDWITSLKNKLSEQDAQREHIEKVQLHKAEVLEAKGYQLFEEIMHTARAGVEAIKTERKDCRDVTYEGINTLSFRVRNPVYPAIKAEVEWASDSIVFKYTRLRDANSNAQEESHKIGFEIDQNDNILLFFKGKQLAGKDDVLHLMLDPIFRLT